MKKILHGALFLIGFSMVVVALIYMSFNARQPKTFNQSDFTIGQIEMKDKIFCQHTLGEFDKEQSFKPLFKVTARCGVWSAGDKIMMAKNTVTAESLKKEGGKK